MTSEATKEKKRRIVRRVLSVTWWIALILLAVLMVSIFVAKIRGEVPRVFGYSVLNIVTGSMEDEIPSGSYILVKNVDPEDIKRDDIICFYSSDPAIYGMPNTHRVVEDPIVTDSGIEFVTRGDANAKNDDYTAKGDNLIGVYVKTMDGLTRFSGFLSGRAMPIIIISLLTLTVAMTVYAAFVVKKDDSEGESDTKK